MKIKIIKYDHEPRKLEELMIYPRHTNSTPISQSFTTNTPYFNMGKFISDLLSPLTLNQYSVKDSLEAAEGIQDNPAEYFHQDYVFVSFDVEALFTSVPLSKTVDVILDRFYEKKTSNYLT